MFADFTTDRWKKELRRLPQITELKQAFREFSDLDFSNKTLDDIEKAYFERINIYPGQIKSIKPHTINLINPIRVRNNVNLEKENIQLTNTFSYPPATFCNWSGRANISKCPVFYCSDDLETSFKEVKPKLEEILFMSFWKINCDREVNFSPILFNNLSLKNHWKPFSDSMFEEMVKFAKEAGIEKQEELILLHNAFAYWFVSEEAPYSKTSWVANKYLYKTNGVDFIVYPSYVNDQNTCSMAFHPNFVDNYFRLEKVISYKVVKINNESSRLKIISVGTPSLTNINWGEPTEEDLKRMKVR